MFNDDLKEVLKKLKQKKQKSSKKPRTDRFTWEADQIEIISEGEENEEDES